ncbi:hypothetical protein WKI13_00665 [Teredinibacter turnerae]|uniref:hypothetical protein n=1 Tax=Teredinibacter turnerae TaxID=2426 RepID=UPI0030D2D473
MLATVLSIVAVGTGLASLWLSNEQWKKVKSKIGMITDHGKAVEVLPAWYTQRMMTDYWHFGLLTVDSGVIAIQRILAISDDGKWMDVELLTKDEIPKGIDEHFVTAVADDRRVASVKIDKIILAYELVTS